MIRLAIQDANFKRLLQASGPAGRQRLYDAATLGMLTLLRAHFRREAPRRHATAHRLGASPTNHLERVTLSREATAQAAYVGIASPGIRRALGPLTIRPRNARALTIPIAAEAYGHRAGELSAKYGLSLFAAKSKAGRGILFGADHDGNIKPLYVLRASAHIPQDRSLLPTLSELRNAVRAEVVKVLNRAKR